MKRTTLVVVLMLSLNVVAVETADAFYTADWGGLLSGGVPLWVPSGYTGVVVAGPDSNTLYSAVLGTNLATTTVSSLSQTFSAPSGATRLSLQYDANCSTPSSAVILTLALGGTQIFSTGNSCGVSGWQSISGPVVAGSAYTVTAQVNPGGASAWLLMANVKLDVPGGISNGDFSNGAPDSQADFWDSTGVDIGALDQQMQAAFPNRVGPIWLDRSTYPTAMHAELVGTIAPTDITTFRSLGADSSFCSVVPQLCILDSGPYTYDQLLSYETTATGLLINDYPGDFDVGIEAAAVDPTSGSPASTDRIRIDSNVLPPTAVADLAANLPANSYRLNSSVDGGYSMPSDQPNSGNNGTPKTSAHGSYPPHVGGLEIDFPNGGFCTTAFTVFTYTNNAYQYYGITAGHCGYTGSHTTIDGTSMGNTTGNHYFCSGCGTTANPSVDVQRYGQISPASNAWASIVKDNGDKITIKGQFLDRQMTHGFYACADGSQGGYGACGTVDIADAKFYHSTDKIVSAHAWFMKPTNRFTIPGDSGGSWFHPSSGGSDPCTTGAGTACGVGIHWGIWDVDDSSCNCTRADMVYTSLIDAEAAEGVNLATG